MPSIGGKAILSVGALSLVLFAVGLVLSRCPSGFMLSGLKLQCAAATTTSTQSTSAVTQQVIPTRGQHSQTMSEQPATGGNEDTGSHEKSDGQNGGGQSEDGPTRTGGTGSEGQGPQDIPTPPDDSQPAQDAANIDAATQNATTTEQPSTEDASDTTNTDKRLVTQKPTTKDTTHISTTTQNTPHTELATEDVAASVVTKVQEIQQQAETDMKHPHTEAESDQLSFKGGSVASTHKLTNVKGYSVRKKPAGEGSSEDVLDITAYKEEAIKSAA